MDLSLAVRKVPLKGKSLDTYEVEQTAEMMVLLKAYTLAVSKDFQWVYWRVALLFEWMGNEMGS